MRFRKTKTAILLLILLVLITTIISFAEGKITKSFVNVEGDAVYYTVEKLINGQYKVQLQDYAVDAKGDTLVEAEEAAKQKYFTIYEKPYLVENDKGQLVMIKDATINANHFVGTDYLKTAQELLDESELFLDNMTEVMMICILIAMITLTIINAMGKLSPNAKQKVMELSIALPIVGIIAGWFRLPPVRRALQGIYFKIANAGNPANYAGFNAKLFDVMKNAPTGIQAYIYFGVMTMVLLFIFGFLQLGAAGSNVQARANAIKRLGVIAISATFLGGITIIWQLFTTL